MHSLYLLYPLLTYDSHSDPIINTLLAPDTSGRLRPVFSSSSESQLSGTSVASKHLWSVLGLVFPAYFLIDWIYPQETVTTKSTF